MKQYFLLFLIVPGLISCNQRKANDTPSADKKVTIDIPELDTSLGPQVAIIEFKVKAIREDLDVFADGFIHSISLDDPNPELKRLSNADEIILPYSSVSLVIDYPVRAPVVFQLTASGKGFSRKALLLQISKTYRAMYEEEESTASDKTIPAGERKGTYNRNQTNGKYGIWGHDLADLVLTLIEVHKNKSGKVTLILWVES